jgi:hypothetical protein
MEHDSKQVKEGSEIDLVKDMKDMSRLKTKKKPSVITIFSAGTSSSALCMDYRPRVGCGLGFVARPGHYSTQLCSLRTGRASTAWWYS